MTLLKAYLYSEPVPSDQFEARVWPKIKDVANEEVHDWS